VKNFVGIRAGGGTQESRLGRKLLLGPWTHMPWTPMGPSGLDGPSTNTIDDWHVRFFDQVLKGEDTGVFDHPVTVFTVDGRWRDLDDWPPPEVTTQEWFVHSGGRANSKFGDGTLSQTPPGDESPDIFVYDSGVPTPSLGGHSCCFDSITPMGPADQHGAEASRMVLVCTSDPFAEDIEILGDVSVTLYAASTALDTDFTARLCVVDSTGRSINLQEGIVRVRYRNSLSEPELMTPGEIYELTIDLGPVGARIPARSRLRLDISSSDFPQWDRNLNTGGTPLHEGPMEAVPATQTVLHSSVYPTRVRIPILTN
jgi:putative CocE/NonD family hydrolase